MYSSFIAISFSTGTSIKFLTKTSISGFKVGVLVSPPPGFLSMTTFCSKMCKSSTVSALVTFLKILSVPSS